MIGSSTYTQTLSSARAIGLAAYTASVKDTRGSDINPAGLVGIKDWEFSASTYAPTTSGLNGFIFQGFSLGKRFLENHAIALTYSPGSVLEFVVPTSLTLVGAIPTFVDQRISYQERFSIGYAYKVTNEFAAGLGARSIEEKITDTQFQLAQQDSTKPFSTFESEYTGTSWNCDLGLTWALNPQITLSAVGRDLVMITKSELPSEFAPYSLPKKAVLELGAATTIGTSFRVAISAGTNKAGMIGYEWNPVHGVALRMGVYSSADESPFIYGIAGGLGWSYEFLEVDASYLGFLNEEKRTGSTSQSQFNPGIIRNIDLNAYTRDRITLSMKAVLGNVRESLARIEGVEILSGVYPSSYEALAYRPIGKVRVKNISGKPIQAKASFYLEKYMDAPTETQPVLIDVDAVQEIALTAVFNDQVRKVSQMAIHEGNVYVSATAAEEYDDRFQARVLIHGKNDWDGDVYSLRYFVTPNDPEIIRYGRDILLQERDSLDDVQTDLKPFYKARKLFDAFAGKLTYISDPKQSGDYVQYPSETLQLRGGDCDDMTVWYSSMLNSIGISTAFIDVVPPDNPGASHIYMLFDTGLDPKFGRNISENPKRFVIRRNSRGAETIWIPIETTVITRGFDDAWTTGAQEYFDHVEVGLGLVKGWVRVVDVY